MKNILITGAAGFIGSSLIDSLYEKGYKIIAIDNFDDNYDVEIKLQNISKYIKNYNSKKKILKEKIREFKKNNSSILQKNNDISMKNKPLVLIESKSWRLYCADIRFQNSLDYIFAEHRIDIVIHLAAKVGVRLSVIKPKEFFEVNVMGTLNILQAMQKAGIKKIIIASSSSVYGNSTKMPYSEKMPTNSPISPYAASKKSCELLAYTFMELCGISTIVLRLFTVYGPRQRPDLAINKFYSAITSGKDIQIYGDGSSFRDYTYIGDTVQGFINAIHLIEDENNTNKFKIYNIGSGRSITLNSLVHLLSEITKQKFKIKYTDIQPGDINYTIADITLAKTELGYQARTPFHIGLKEFIKWRRTI